jgi:hypothetical protein
MPVHMARDTYISRAKWTGVTEKSQIWKKLLVEFISQNIIKKGPKYEKNQYHQIQVLEDCRRF